MINRLYGRDRRAGLAASNGEARRLIKGGGARLNDAPVAQEAQPVTLAAIGAEGVIKLSAGKKRHALVRAARPPGARRARLPRSA